VANRPLSLLANYSSLTTEEKTMPTVRTIKVETLANSHCHLRKKELAVILALLAISGRADAFGIMPNVGDGLKTAREVSRYIEHIRSGLREAGSEPVNLIPMMMVTEKTDPDEINQCVEMGIWDVKIYPLDRTTGSGGGVRDYQKILLVIRRCGELGVRVHFHPEHPWSLFNNRDAEYAFLSVVDMFLRETEAKIFWEHGTDARCIPFWEEMGKTGRFFITLTAHHLATDEDEVFGDVRGVCKPPIKTREDKEALINFVRRNHNWVIAGLDDAPHNRDAKHPSEGRCACGAYTAPFGLQLYAHALDKLLETEEGITTFVNFTSRNARRVFNLSSGRIVTLRREPFKIPATYEADDWVIESFWAGQTLNWSLL